jgi:flagellar basal-body rod protein FlgG
MYRGFYTAANGILNEQRIMNTISNNIANVKTAGYKSDTAIPTTFEESLLLINGKTSKTGTIRYRTLEDTDTDLAQGTFDNTGSRLDIALKGPVYFNIQSYNNDEVLLTRNGQFTIDSEGYLSLSSCGRILNAEGEPIQLGTANFKVSEDGVITLDDGRTITLGLTYLPEDTAVDKVGDNMLRPYEEFETGNVPENIEYKVMQGWYERSNVDIAEQTVNAMHSQQVFNSCAAALKIINSVNQIACNNLAKIN